MRGVKAGKEGQMAREYIRNGDEKLRRTRRPGG